MDRLISEQAVLNVINRYGTDELRIKAIKAIPSVDIEQVYMKGKEDGVNDFIKKSLIDE